MPPAAIKPLAKREPGEISLSASAASPPAFFTAWSTSQRTTPPHEDGQRGADGQIGADGEGERADAEQLDGDDQRDAEQDQAPGELAAEDAVDDGGHEPGLRGGRGFLVPMP